MRGNRRILILAVVGMLVVACGGSAATATPIPTAADGGGGDVTPTAATGNGAGGGGTTPTPATGGGGGGKPAGWDQYGTVHYDISGPTTLSGDLGFIPAGSLFGGSNGSSLSFTIDGTDTVLTIAIAAGGQLVVTFGNPDVTIPAAQCTASNLNVAATSASGSFECTAAMAFTSSGAALTGARITGTFQAHV